ncbi:MAG: elongation factor G [Chloroflexota bacterium]
MKSYDADHVFNVALVSHGGAGKTSLVEAMLFTSGAITRLGSVEEGNTTSDFDPDEQKRRMSVSLSLAPLEWDGNKVNLLDTPGYADFFGELIEGVHVADAAIVVIDGTSGVQVGTESAWRECEARGLPRIVYVNRLDRENSDYERTLEQLRERYGKHLVPVTAPIGREHSFSGVVDLLSRKAYAGAGAAPSDDVPADAAAAVDRLREMLVESVCELDDDLLNLYLEGEEVDTDAVRHVLADGVRGGSLIPVCCGSATHQVGITPLLDLIVGTLPPASSRTVPLSEGTTGADGKLAALAFKTISDPYIGRLSYVRVYSGALNADGHVWNSAKGKDERVGQLFFMRGKTQETTPRISAGDIGVIPKLADTSTGDTLTQKDGALFLVRPKFPETSYSASIHPKTRADVDKLSTALQRIMEEDPTLKIFREESTGETIMSGLGESHVAISAERLQRKYGVSVEVGLPRVAYRETVNGTAKALGRHVRQSGGHGQYGVCHLEIEPLDRGAQFEFVDKIVGGVVPKQFIPAIEKGVREAMDVGPLAGYPVVDVRVSLFDGKYHPVDSSEAAFKMAGSIGFKQGMMDARPVLLEPVMQVEITVPDEFTGDVMGDLNSRRARVQGMNPAGGFTTIGAQVPQAEMLRYATELRSMTQGRGAYSMHFSHYEEVPAHTAQKVIDERKKEHAESRA